MSTTSYIRRFIHRLEYGQVFTSRDLLNYGRRSAIDQAIHRLIKAEYIYRLARGVFIKAEYANQYIISAVKIATIKAQSFGKQIVSHAQDIAHQLKLANAGNSKLCFATTGASSSFQFGNIRIWFNHVCARKIKLGESKAGAALRAVWHLGKSWYLEQLRPPGPLQRPGTSQHPGQPFFSQLDAISRNFLRHERLEFRSLAALTPAWLHDPIVRPSDWPIPLPISTVESTNLDPFVMRNFFELNKPTSHTQFSPCPGERK